LGFREVHDYMPGKMDWLAYGLAVEKRQDGSPMLIERIERQVPTCGLKDSVGEAKGRADKLGSQICAVVNDRGIVLGLLREDAWKNDPDVPAEKAMESGPTTLRPSYPVGDATELLVKRSQDAILVTSSDGKLMGVFKRPESAPNKQTPKSEIW
jgi:predicted transcriptional regulator